MINTQNEASNSQARLRRRYKNPTAMSRLKNITVIICLIAFIFYSFAEAFESNDVTGNKEPKPEGEGDGLEGLIIKNKTKPSFLFFSTTTGSDKGISFTYRSSNSETLKSDGTTNVDPTLSTAKLSSSTPVTHRLETNSKQTASKQSSRVMPTHKWAQTTDARNSKSSTTLASDLSTQTMVISDYRASNHVPASRYTFNDTQPSKIYTERSFQKKDTPGTTSKAFGLPLLVSSTKDFTVSYSPHNSPHNSPVILKSKQSTSQASASNLPALSTSSREIKSPIAGVFSSSLHELLRATTQATDSSRSIVSISTTKVQSVTKRLATSNIKDTHKSLGMQFSVTYKPRTRSTVSYRPLTTTKLESLATSKIRNATKIFISSRATVSFSIKSNGSVIKATWSLPELSKMQDSKYTLPVIASESKTKNYRITQSAQYSTQVVGFSAAIQASSSASSIQQHSDLAGRNSSHGLVTSALLVSSFNTDTQSLNNSSSRRTAILPQRGTSVIRNGTRPESTKSGFPSFTPYSSIKSALSLADGTASSNHVAFLPNSTNVHFKHPLAQSSTFHGLNKRSHHSSLPSKSAPSAKNTASILENATTDVTSKKLRTAVVSKPASAHQLTPNASVQIVLKTSPIHLTPFSVNTLPSRSTNTLASHRQSMTQFFTHISSVSAILSTRLTRLQSISDGIPNEIPSMGSSFAATMQSTPEGSSLTRNMESVRPSLISLSRIQTSSNFVASTAARTSSLGQHSKEPPLSSKSGASLRMTSSRPVATQASLLTASAIRPSASRIPPRGISSMIASDLKRSSKRSTRVVTAATTSAGKYKSRKEVSSKMTTTATTVTATAKAPAVTTNTPTSTARAVTTNKPTTEERPVTGARTTSEPIYIGEPKLHTKLIEKFSSALNVEFHVSFPGILQAYKLQIVAQKYDHLALADKGTRLRTWYQVHYFEDYKHDAYVVVEFTKKHLVERSNFNFTIGNDVQCEVEQVRFQYCNGPLHQGAYRLRLLYHVHGDVKKSAFSKAYTTAATTITPKDENTGLNQGNITIAVIAVLAILLVIIVIIAAVLYKRKNNNTGGENCGDSEVSECTLLASLKRTSSCSKGCYGRGTLGTGDSSLMLKSLTKGMSRPVHVKDFIAWVNRSQADSDFRFAEEFESIRDIGRDQSNEASDVPENRGKNRYVNVLAYDKTRVKLSYTDDEIGSDYINANYIHGHKHPRAYIATQGPLPGTTDDFWRMIWEQNTHVIVMATQCVERNRVKCHQYWPGVQPTAFGDIVVSLLSEFAYPEWVEREFLLEVEDDGSRRIRHFQYTAWPDHGVPKNAATALEFIHNVRANIVSGQGPVVIHCSAGVGRTGTLIAIDTILDRLQDEDTIDVYLCLCLMRLQRCHMVQTEEQYIFIHRVLVEYLKSRNPSSPLRGYSLLPKEEENNEAEPDDSPNRDSGLALLLNEYDTEQVEVAIESVA